MVVFVRSVLNQRGFSQICLLDKNNCVYCSQMTVVVEVYNKGVMATLSRVITVLWPGTGNEWIGRVVLHEKGGSFSSRHLRGALPFPSSLCACGLLCNFNLNTRQRKPLATTNLCLVFFVMFSWIYNKIQCSAHCNLLAQLFLFVLHK